MKIIRITLTVKDAQFFVDRPYEHVKKDFENCDMAMKWLSNTYKDEGVIAAMKLTAGAHFQETDEAGKTITKFDPFYGAIPALLNMRMLAYMCIDNVGIYEQPEAADDENVKRL